MSNLKIFKQYLQEENIFMEEEILDEDATGFIYKEPLDNGDELNIVISITNYDKLDSQLVFVHILQIVKINNLIKKESIHSLLYQLNNKYDFGKFIENDGYIENIYMYGALPSSLDPSFLIGILSLIIDSVVENYNEIMSLSKNNSLYSSDRKSVNDAEYASAIEAMIEQDSDTFAEYGVESWDEYNYLFGDEGDMY